MSPGPGLDGSPRARGDASVLQLGDASLVDRGDASPDAGDDGPRLCAWCDGPIPGSMRADAECCCKGCRQARWRFTRQIARLEAAARALRLAYGDPPYPGKAGLYRGHPDYAGEVDHRALLLELATYDGWALSTSAEALPAVLALVDELGLEGVRVAAWVKGARGARAAGPLSSWEPVLYKPARQVVGPQPADSLVHGINARTTDPSRVIGAKPAAFCTWLFALLGARAGDSLADLFPGSGGVARAWEAAQAG